MLAIAVPDAAHSSKSSRETVLCNSAAIFSASNSIGCACGLSSKMTGSSTFDQSILSKTGLSGRSRPRRPAKRSISKPSNSVSADDDDVAVVMSVGLTVSNGLFVLRADKPDFALLFALSDDLSDDLLVMSPNARRGFDVDFADAVLLGADCCRCDEFVDGLIASRDDSCSTAFSSMIARAARRLMMTMQSGKRKRSVEEGQIDNHLNWQKKNFLFSFHFVCH